MIALSVHFHVFNVITIQIFAESAKWDFI